MSVKFESAVIFVRDVEASRGFYEGLLGQEVMMDHGPNVAFRGGFAIWEIEHASQIVFGQPPEGEGRLGHDNLELYFVTDDLDTAWTQLSNAGVEVVHPLREQPWGQRVLRVYDPDGHVVELGEPIPVFVRRFLDQGMSVEAVAERTSLPVEVVREIGRSRDK
jgi:catechol 2,3-dioxygenase-like lactoylglutathione lyase family enzyme